MTKSAGVCRPEGTGTRPRIAVTGLVRARCRRLSSRVGGDKTRYETTRNKAVVTTKANSVCSGGRFGSRGRAVGSPSCIAYSTSVAYWSQRAACHAPPHLPELQIDRLQIVLIRIASGTRRRLARAVTRFAILDHGPPAQLRNSTVSVCILRVGRGPRCFRKE